VGLNNSANRSRKYSKGFTLKSLAKTFEIETEKIILCQRNFKIDRAKLINLSVLMGLIIPLVLSSININKQNQ
jgi:hypothetical protein